MPWQREPSGDDFVARLARGDEPTWADFYRQHAGRVAGYVRSKGATDADDLVGDVFAAAAERIHRFEGGEAELRSWLFTIAHHRLADDLRRRNRRATDPTEPSDLEGVDAAIREGADAIGDATARLDAEGALAMLSWVTDEQREVLTLRILGQLSIAETATVLGKPPGAVKALQHRAIARIQRQMGKGPYPNGLSDDGSDEP